MASKIDRLLKPKAEEFKLNGERTHHKENNSEIEHKYDEREAADSRQLTITEKLQNLPKISAGKKFDQKMAAAFAMELENETLKRNKSWLIKHPQISLPDILPNLTKNLF